MSDLQEIKESLRKAIEPSGEGYYLNDADHYGQMMCPREGCDGWVPMAVKYFVPFGGSEGQALIGGSERCSKGCKITNEERGVMAQILIQIALEKDGITSSKPAQLSDATCGVCDKQLEECKC